MFPVSSAYLAAVSQKTRTWNILVDVLLSTGEQLTLTHKHLANKPFTFTEGATCTSTLHTGSTFSNSVEFTVLDVEHDFAGALVRPRVGLLLESGDFEYVPLGEFSVVDLSRQTMSTVLYCYDGMSTLNRVFDVHLITYPATVFSVVHAACEQAGVRMSPDLEAELQTLDTPVHSLEKVECTCRDIVASAGVLLCKSMRFNREGLLESFWYSSVDRDTTAATRVKTSKYEDRTVCVTGVVLGDPFNQKYQYGSSDYAVELLRNPFLQDYSYVIDLAPKVLAALQRVVYKPSTVYYIGDPALQAGDIVQHNLGAKGVLSSPIMKMTYVYRGTSTLEAVGVSAAQLKQHSSVDKQVVTVQQQSNRYVDQALASQTQEDIFNKLTNNGKDSGIFLVDHKILINADYIGAGSLSADIIRAGQIRSTDFAVEELQELYPAADLYPSATTYPNNGEQIIRGFEIDFESGVIRGVFWSDAIAALEDRVLTLETQLSYTEKAVSDLQAENAELQANVSQLENEVAVQQNVISTLGAQITALQIAGQERDSRLTKLETSLVYPKSAT